MGDATLTDAVPGFFRPSGVQIPWLPAEHRQTEMALAAASGASIIGLDFDWRRIEPEPGAFDWEGTDEAVALAKQHGLRLAPMLLYTPRRASTTPFAIRDALRAPPQNTEDYRNFVYAVVDRYKPYGASPLTSDGYGIADWFFYYLETERNYSPDAVLLTMSVAVVVLAAGYPIGGALGDYLFKRTRRGRLIVATAGVLLGALFLFITLSVPPGDQTRFLILLSVTAVFIPFAASNVIATVYDVTLPEVRSSALAVQYFIESAGAALAPLLAGAIADRASMEVAILIICVSAWVICALFFVGAAARLPGDIETLRRQCRERAERLRSA